MSLIIQSSLHRSGLADFNKHKPGQIELNINAIKERIFRYGVNPRVLRKVLLLSHEIGELVSMLPSEMQMSLAL